MSTLHHASQRTSPSVLKKTALRTRRPSIPRALSSPKLAKPGKSKAVERTVEDEDDDMAASFLQFCTYCEIQIAVPNNSILYCSESCRRKDSKASPTPVYDSTSSPPSPTSPTTRTIVPFRQPTVRPVPSLKPPMLHAAKSDLDPTEWKPNLPRCQSSEAYTYLSSFHRSSASLSATRRPALQTRHTTSALMAQTAPSLSHTPVSTTSSEGSMNSQPYTFMPPKRDAFERFFFTSPTKTTKSVDLVKPVSIPCVPAIVRKKGDSFEHFVYEKRDVVGSSEDVHVAGSLKKLLALEESGEM